MIGKKIIGNVTAKNYLKESLWSILRFIINRKGSSWDQFDPEIYFVAILRMVVNSSCCVICELNWKVFMAIVKHFPVKMKLASFWCVNLIKYTMCAS